MSVRQIKSKIQSLTGLSSGQLHGYGSIALTLLFSLMWLGIDLTAYFNATPVGMASALGFASALLVGAAVEGIDWVEYGDFNGGDMISNFSGSAIGVALFWVGTTLASSFL